MAEAAVAARRSRADAGSRRLAPAWRLVRLRYCAVYLALAARTFLWPAGGAGAQQRALRRVLRRWRVLERRILRQRWIFGRRGIFGRRVLRWWRRLVGWRRRFGELVMSVSEQDRARIATAIRAAEAK